MSIRSVVLVCMIKVKPIRSELFVGQCQEETFLLSESSCPPARFIVSTTYCSYSPSPSSSTPSTSPIMSLLSTSAASIVRQGARQPLPLLRSSTTAIQKRNRADAATQATTAAKYTSPFRGTSDHKDTTVIPSFKKYRNSGGETQNKVFQYFMVGTFGAVSALGAKATVQGTPIYKIPRLLLQNVADIHG